MRNCFVVVSNKSWYEGYIPFYIFFARRACPDTHVLVYLMGELEPETQQAIKAISGNPSGYTLIENYKPEYGQSAIAAKTARFTIDDDRIRSFDAAYIGDIDMLICKEDEDLFVQHWRNASSIGIPISNMIRFEKATRRLTGLHFLVTAPYFEAMAEAIQRLDHKIASLVASGSISETWTTSVEDEEELYKMIATARPDWIAAMEPARFRPHHGTHMGHFRNPKAGSFKTITERIATSGPNRYHRDTRTALPPILALPEITALFTCFPKLGKTFDNFMQVMESAEARATPLEATQG